MLKDVLRKLPLNKHDDNSSEDLHIFRYQLECISVSYVSTVFLRITLYLFSLVFQCTVNRHVDQNQNEEMNIG